MSAHTAAAQLAEDKVVRELSGQSLERNLTCQR